jgi:hypothetical protein
VIVLDEVESYDWLIRARTRIQEGLLDLLRLGRLNDGELFFRHPSFHQLFGLLTGAAFSLWRASFLTNVANVARTPEITHDSALQVLGGALQINAGLLTFERETEEWMGGYYLNNCRYRLRRAASLPTIAAEIESSEPPPGEVTRVLRLGLGIPAGDLKNSWDDCCTTLIWMTQQLRKSMELVAVTPPPEGGS